MKSRAPNWGKTPWKVEFRGKARRLPGHVDVAIIGGGFTGLTAAAYVKRADAKQLVLLLEAAWLGNGASGRTGGMVLAQSAAGNLRGLGDVLAGYKTILHELHINADLNLRGAWEIARGMQSMEGKKIRPVRSSPIDWNDSGRVRIVKKVPGGSVDPGKVVTGLARAAKKAGVHIAENSKVTRIEPSNPIRIQIAARGNRTKIITASRVLLATNAGGLQLAREIFPQASAPEPKLTFALAIAPLTKKQIDALGMASGRPFYTVDLPYLWGRMMKNSGMIFGSGLVPAFGESLARGDGKKLWHGLEKESVLRGASLERLNALERRVRALHPALQNARITHRWGGPILLTKSFVPVFRAHPKNKNLIFLGAYSGHGVAQSVYLGRRAAEVLLGKRGLPKWA